MYSGGSQDEVARLAALASYDILDTRPEAAYDGLARLSACLLGTPTALISFVAHDRKWCKARYGPDAAATVVDIALCPQVIARDAPVIINGLHCDD